MRTEPELGPGGLPPALLHSSTLCPQEGTLPGDPQGTWGYSPPASTFHWRRGAVKRPGTCPRSLRGHCPQREPGSAQPTLPGPPWLAAAPSRTALSSPNSHWAWSVPRMVRGLQTELRASGGGPWQGHPEKSRGHLPGAPGGPQGPPCFVGLVPSNVVAGRWGAPSSTFRGENWPQPRI